VSRRNGGWWSAGDATPGATIEPGLGAAAVPVSIPGGRCGSRFAMRVSGQGFEEWGSMIGLSFVYGSGGILEYDASAYQGMTFWARIGDTSINQVRFAISDRNTEPQGGVCVEDGPPGQGCFDSFGVVLSNLDTRWKRYRIPFAGLTQRDFGLRTEALLREAVYSVNFAFEPGAVFDLWLDDLEFF
jgi:hypothetical protein